jgi:hypothetical protein
MPPMGPQQTEQLVCEHTHNELVAFLTWVPSAGDAQRTYNAEGKLEEVKAGGGLDCTDEFGWTCLHHAAALGLTHHVEALLDAGASVDLRTLADTSYPSGLDALGVARHTQREGWGDRLYICRVLQWAADAQGSGAAGEGGGWRTLQRRDEEGKRLQALEADKAARLTQLQAEAFVTSEAQAKWSVRAELAARERRARRCVRTLGMRLAGGLVATAAAAACAGGWMWRAGRRAEKQHKAEAAQHARVRERAEELELAVASLSEQAAATAAARSAAESSAAELGLAAECVLLSACTPWAEGWCRWVGGG